MTNRSRNISIIYPELQQVARRIMRGKPDYKDLLNEVMLQILESKSENVPDNVPDLRKYCITAIKISAHSNKSKFNMKLRRWNKIRCDISRASNTKLDVFLGDRADNEMIDTAINLLPDLERKTFLIYAFDDFSYAELSKKTGVPKAQLYNIVNSAKTLLRQYVTNQ